MGIVIVILVAGLLGGYVFYFTDLGVPRNKDSDREEVLTEEEQKINQLKDQLFKMDGQGNVQVGAMFMNPMEENEDYYIFKTQFNTHSVDIDQYDLGKMAIFTTGDGIVLKDEIIWEKLDGEGHHYIGNYRIPKSIDGKPIITENTQFIELNISELDGIQNRRMIWERDTLELIN